MTTRNAEDPIDILTTTIYKSTEFGDRMVGALDSDGVLTTPGDPKARGRVSSAGTVFRVTTYGEREIGTVSPTGTVHSHGLFEGGELGWLEEDGAVMRGGLIIEEEVVGRVDGPQPAAAAAALLLILLPDDDTATRESRR